MEECASDTPEVITHQLEAIQETGHILSDLKETTPAGTQAYERLTLLFQMLGKAKAEVEEGRLQEGLWFSKSVITFLLNGTSTDAVPLAPVEAI